MTLLSPSNAHMGVCLHVVGLAIGIRIPKNPNWDHHRLAQKIWSSQYYYLICYLNKYSLSFKSSYGSLHQTYSMSQFFKHVVQTPASLKHVSFWVSVLRSTPNHTQFECRYPIEINNWISLSPFILVYLCVLLCFFQCEACLHFLR